jgi:phosphatidylinositol glycan class B
VLLARSADAVGVGDPFRQALAFRLFSALLLWTALLSFTLTLPMLLPGPGQRRWAVRLTWLAFWTPFLAARTSSESVSASLTVLAIVVLARATLGGRGSLPLLGAGLLFGLAFEARFAAGVVPAGLAAWGLATHRLRPRDVGVLAAGVLPAGALSALVDRWGYGGWAFPPLHYLEVNIWQGVAAERFGSRPWHGYLSLAGGSDLAPLLLLTFAGAATAWIRFPGHLLCAATYPFVVVHLALAHKETRFLLPVAPLADLAS